jgi:hypothetical protein
MLTRLLMLTMLSAGAVGGVILASSTPQGDMANTNCRGLHAGIKAELVRRDPPYTQPPFVQLSFNLLNDGESPANSAEGSWKLFIDGKEVPRVWDNGLRPVGGYGTLNPGESYQLGIGLELSRYFPEVRDYKVYWTGMGFQSPTITVRITPKPQLPA